jgi:hypothetical protein
MTTACTVQHVYFLNQFQNITSLQSRAKLKEILFKGIVLPPEAAEAFRKWRGIGQKGHFCI